MQELKENEKLLEGKADFLLAACVTYTCEIPQLTQAGIPGKIPLTPTLDAEFISTGKVFSLGDIAETPKGVPTPALITRAVQELSPFTSLKILDLGLKVHPENCDCIDFDILPSPSITDAQSFDAKLIFEKGFAFGKTYELQGDYLILAESTPSGTTTAQACISALGYETKGLFASSFKDAPSSIKEETISASLAKLNSNMSLFERLGHCADNMLMFTAGFILSASRRFNLVLAGGTQMAAVLLIANKISIRQGIHHDHRHIHLCTTQWIAKDKNSNIQALLDQLDYRLKAYYAHFSFKDSQHPALKLYDEGEAKEGVGAGACIAYAFAQSISQKELTQKIESYLA
ncbi:nicotinate-nucleotide--dimethylbenzimidazole phosphoribosyltransferase [Sulfurimonas sp. MAG313]|nr:nicotinate-nucleotide--dimethylbenzimidazole phosphoribosyltransferase [Sulfurimonas sp. MAG313]MDF1881641.1 nicotinate-nucleotide--dimethylbenzimidazole phosphoribosyltransferase [Sulfurimonas sp. MAG313]